jgi:hypothetical protein
VGVNLVSLKKALANESIAIALAKTRPYNDNAWTVELTQIPGNFFNERHDSRAC